MAVEKYKFKGLKELSKSLDGLTEPKFRKAALRKAGKQSMSPVLSALKSNAPVWKDPSTVPKGSRPGELRDDIKMSVSVNATPKVNSRGKVTASSKNELKVTIKTGKRTEDYALVSEYGRDEHSFTKYTVFGQEVLGFTATLPALNPKPWYRPTFDSMKDQVVKSFANELRKSIEQQAKKQAKFNK